MEPTSIQIKQIRLRAKIVRQDGKRHPAAALRVLFVQLERPAQQHVLIVQQVSFEQEEVEMARLVPRAQLECTRRR